MKKPNLIIGIGMLILAITLILKYLIELPDLISGLGIGLAIGIELIGVYIISNNKKQYKSDK